MSQNKGNDSDLLVLAGEEEVLPHSVVVAENFIKKIERYPQVDPTAFVERRADRARLGSDYGQDS